MPESPTPMPEDDPEDDLEIEGGPQVLGGRQAVEDALRRHVHIESFPIQSAGTHIGAQEQNAHTTYAQNVHDSRTNPYAPFNTRINWEFAKWAKLDGPGANSLNKLLAIPGVGLN